MSQEQNMVILRNTIKWRRYFKARSWKSQLISQHKMEIGLLFWGGSCQCNVVATFFLWGEKCISRTLNMMCTTCNPGLQTLPQLSRDPAEEGMLLEVFTRFLTESDRLEREFNLPQQWLSDIYKPTGSKPGKWILDETEWHLVTNSKP